MTRNTPEMWNEFWENNSDIDRESDLVKEFSSIRWKRIKKEIIDGFDFNL